MEGMSESELCHTFETHGLTRAGFRGVFARDELRNAPVLNEGNTFIVFNTGLRKSGGLHWIAIFRTRKGVVLYLDSLGAEPTLVCALNYLGKHQQHVIKYNDVRMQSVLSSCCGEFTCVYVAELCAGRTFRDITQDYYKKYLLLNDIVVVSRFRSLFGFECCQPSALKCKALCSPSDLDIPCDVVF
jgi:hypothetical protein